MADGFARVAANPYSWPFDGRWCAGDSAMLVLGFQNGTVTALDAEAELKVAATLVEAGRVAGLPVIASRRGRAETSLRSPPGVPPWAREWVTLSLRLKRRSGSLLKRSGSRVMPRSSIIRATTPSIRRVSKPGSCSAASAISSWRPAHRGAAACDTARRQRHGLRMHRDFRCLQGHDRRTACRTAPHHRLRQRAFRHCGAFDQIIMALRAH